MMLKSYEAIIENGHVKWLYEIPEIKSARIIISDLAEKTPNVNHRTFPLSIAGKGKTLDDIVRPIVDEKKWQCLN
jgi:hypothetical protein